MVGALKLNPITVGLCSILLLLETWNQSNFIKGGQCSPVTIGDCNPIPLRVDPVVSCGGCRFGTESHRR